MRGLLALGLQDFNRLLKNALFWVITATLVLIVSVVDFALPDDVSEKSPTVYACNTSYAAGSAVPVSGEDELRRLVRETGGIGLLGDGDGLTVIHPGLSEKTVRAVVLLLGAHGDPDIDVESLNKAGRTIPFNQRMTPVFICFEALIVGFILGGALMLSEKEERTIRALRVSPMGVDRYLISKTLLFSIIGTLYALLMAFFCVGFGFSVIRFVLLSFFGAAVFSLIGLAFSSLFRDMSSWFFTMALLLAVNMLPVVAYSEPSFSPGWLKAIPSYTMIFAYERILFGGDGGGLAVTLTVAAWCAGAYLLSRIAVEKFLLKERGRGR
jgi:hypothetical protein